MFLVFDPASFLIPRCIFSECMNDEDSEVGTRYARPESSKYFALFECLVKEPSEASQVDPDESRDGVALSSGNAQESSSSSRQSPLLPPPPRHQPDLLDRERDTTLAPSVGDGNTPGGLGLDLGPAREPPSHRSLVSIDGMEVDQLLSGPPTEPPAPNADVHEPPQGSPAAGGKKRKGLQDDNKDVSGDPSAPSPLRKSPRVDVLEGGAPESASAPKPGPPPTATADATLPVAAPETAPSPATMLESLSRMKYSDLQALAKVRVGLATLSACQFVDVCPQKHSIRANQSRDHLVQQLLLEQ